MRTVEIINLASSAHSLLKERVLAMRASGIDSRILCMDGAHVARLRAAGIPVHTVHLGRGINPLRLLIAFVEITLYLRRHRIELVHTHCSIPGVVGRLAAWCVGVPVILHTVHGFHFHEGTPPLLRVPAVAVERLCGAMTDTLLFQNRSDLEQAHRYGIGPRQRRGFIGNGIDLSRFQAGPRRRADGTPIVIVCVARLEPVKNHAMLLEAAHVLKGRGERFRLWLVGEGPLRGALEDECRRLGLEDVVEFLGYRDDVPALLAAADIGVLTSIKEGLPRAAVEAMAARLPVVATRVSGTREAVRHGVTGFTVPLGDSDALAAALTMLIGDRALRERLGARGRRVAVEEYDEREIVSALRRIYRVRLLARGVPDRGRVLPEVWRDVHVPTGVDR